MLRAETTGPRREVSAMPLTPELRRAIDRIRDYLFAGGYPDPAQNAEQLSFLIYFYMFEAADAARVRATRRPGAKQYAGAFVGDWTLRNPRNARGTGFRDGPARDAALVRLGECAQWPAARVVVARGSFPLPLRDRRRGRHRLHGRCAAGDRRADCTLAGREPRERPAPRTGGRRHQGDLFEHVLRQIRQAGELGQVPHAASCNSRHGSACRSPVGRNGPRPSSRTAGFLVGAYDHIRLG